LAAERRPRAYFLRPTPLTGFVVVVVVGQVSVDGITEPSGQVLVLVVVVGQVCVDRITEPSGHVLVVGVVVVEPRLLSATS
jgi:hypothetical protein